MADRLVGAAALRKTKGLLEKAPAGTTKLKQYADQIRKPKTLAPVVPPPVGGPVYPKTTPDLTGNELPAGSMQRARRKRAEYEFGDGKMTPIGRPKKGKLIAATPKPKPRAKVAAVKVKPKAAAPRPASKPKPKPKPTRVRKETMYGRTAL